jgi:hypothetical protein
VRSLRKSALFIIIPLLATLTVFRTVELWGAEPQAKDAIERWAAQGFHTPQLGETQELLRQFGFFRLIPGVGFVPPEVPERYASSFDRSFENGAAGVFEANRSTVWEMSRTVGPDSTRYFWQATQLPHGLWDYKYLANRGDALGARELSAIGYFNGGYTGVEVYSRGDLLSGYGEFKALQLDASRLLEAIGLANLAKSLGIYTATDYGPYDNIVSGNKPSGWIWANMGADYNESGQFIRDRDVYSQDIDERTIAEFIDIMKISANEEFEQRETALRNEAAKNDHNVYNEMIRDQLELEKAKAMEAKKIAERKRQDEEAKAEQRARRQREQEEEEERRRRQVYFYPSPTPGGPSPSPWPSPTSTGCCNISPAHIAPYQPPPSFLPPWQPIHGGGNSISPDPEASEESPEVSGPD